MKLRTAVPTDAELNQIFLDALPPVAMLLRPHTREIVACNKAGRDVGAVPGKTCYETWGERDGPCPWCLAPEVWATGEAQHLQPEGVGRFWDAHWIPVSEDLYLHYAYDITDRKQIETDRERLITQLKAANAELEGFTYTVSHDLKSPLVTISGFLALIEKDMAAEDSEAVEDDIARIGEAAEKMKGLIDYLLELSRIGRLMNPPEEVALGELAHEIGDSLSTLPGNRGVELDIATDLPVVYGDRVRLSELLSGLIDNAIKYSGDQQVPRVEIGVRSGEDTPVIFVRDDGIGIAPQYHEAVFNLFRKLGAEGEGAGVGLNIAKRVVEVHGGRIWVESEGEGKGSTFCFTLPHK